jgi:anti-sigma factor RsiW
MPKPVAESDLHAFVDGQLDAARRLEVELYLTATPGLAALAQLDMRAKDLLRLAFSGLKESPSPILLDAAHRLERGIGWRRVSLRLRLAATGF